MTVKKNAINISIIMILASFLIAVLCWPQSSNGVPALVYTLASGIFGSSFATLWFFIYEYNRAKQELLSTIFEETVCIMENSTLPFLSHFGFYEPGIKEAMVGKHYISPVYPKEASNMSREERCHYELCRFVDEMLDIGYGRIKGVCDQIESIDFLSDSFRHNSKRRDRIIEKIMLPLREVFICAPAMEDGYLFRYFKSFKFDHSCTSDKIYPLVAKLDKALHIPADPDNTWSRTLDLRGHLHEQLWIFRDAFYDSRIPKKQRRQAWKAFMKNTPYPYIR